MKMQSTREMKEKKIFKLNGTFSRKNVKRYGKRSYFFEMYLYAREWGKKREEDRENYMHKDKRMDVEVTNHKYKTKKKQTYTQIENPSKMLFIFADVVDDSMANNLTQFYNIRFLE